VTKTIFENKPKRRDQLVIMAEIVEIARYGTSKTHIMFRGNLSFNQLNQYLQILLEKGLLEKRLVSGKGVYKATIKGIEFMEKQYYLIDFVNEEDR
jgi:predicted transcriptional regulator